MATTLFLLFITLVVICVILFLFYNEKTRAFMQKWSPVIIFPIVLFIIASIIVELSGNAEELNDFLLVVRFSFASIFALISLLLVFATDIKDKVIHFLQTYFSLIATLALFDVLSWPITIGGALALFILPFTDYLKSKQNPTDNSL